MYDNYLKSQNRKSFLLKMKYTIFFLFLGLNLSYALNTYSQSTLLTINLKDKSMKEVFTEIEKNSEFIFIYEDAMDLSKKVSIQAKKENINSILNKLFESTNMQYIISDRQIAISQKSPPPQAPTQQGIRVTGTVSDDYGELLPGVSVTVRGTNIGISADANGEFALTVPSDTCVLQFSYIGYKSQEIKVGARRIFAIIMIEDVSELSEVVVVAFGTQKKESLVSSITTINPNDLKVPSSNLTTAFAGRMSGVIAYQRSGEPGLDNAEFFIRGITSFSAGGKKDPLILIDGIEMNSTDLAKINPDDISSFSVMKDANAAALYGARGANGVILITTKEGEADKLSINIRAELSTSANSELVALADPITYMTLHNEAIKTRDATRDRKYSPYKIYHTERGTDPVMYPSVDWYNYLIKDRTFNQRVNANVTGGGKAVQYYVAANYQHDTGIIKESEENMFNNNIDINRFQLRSNVTIKLLPQTKGMIRFYGTFDETQGPTSGGANVFHLARNATPVMFLPYYPKDEANEHTKHILFGAAETASTYINPLAEIVSGYSNTRTSMMLAQLELDHSFDGILKGLFARAIINLKRESGFNILRAYIPFYYTPLTTADGTYRLHCFNPETGTEYLSYGFGSRSVINSMYAEARTGYNKVFAEKHDLNVLLVATFRSEIDATILTIQGSLPSRNISTAGRLAYAYDSRYFIEGNFGYNGSERFATKNRWGFFPAVGAGWMVSNESFMVDFRDMFNMLKLKATYGLVGNDRIGNINDRFFYLSQVNMNNSARGFTFGTDLTQYRSGVSIDRYRNDLITWEIAKKLNIGIELGLYKDLNVMVDYFTERRENILQTRSDIPTTMGLVTIPQANVGIAQGKGIEGEIKYQKSYSPNIWLIVNGNFTYATAKYVRFEEPNYPDAPWRSAVGNKLSQPFGYIAERLFLDENEVNNSPVQSFGAYTAGDIKYKDINKDGKIDDSDRVPIGFPTTPEIIYGTGFSFGVYRFDISCFFQGSARSSFFITPSAITPFINNGQRGLLQYIADDHWSESNRDLHAFWPRLSEYAVDNNNYNSTWWLQNGAFLRLKTAEIGYTLPERISKKTGMSFLRIYMSGVNLAVWSKFKMWDPEMAGNGLGYPIQRVFNLGINVNF